MSTALEWQLVGNLQGPPGTGEGGSGTTILSGTSAPTSGTGVDGNYYLDTDSHILYGPKSGSSWPIAIAEPLVLGPTTPVPAGTPAGFIIVRTVT